MNKMKIRLDGSSDYAILLKKYEELKQDVPMDVIITKLKKVADIEVKLKYAEETLNKTLDLINNNEDLAHFFTTKKEIRKPIEEYFKKVK